MKVFVTGVNGQLGHDVMNELYKRGYEGIGSDITPCYSGIALGESEKPMSYESLDITDAEAVCTAIEKYRPDAVIHCAAWTAVDAAEAQENKAKVERINVIGTQNIAEACKNTDAKMIYISTDYVFDGQGESPWDADDHNYRPLNVYGKSKLDGELAVSSILDKYFIVRTAWVFGHNGGNFITTMLRVGRDRDTVTVVDDQMGTPTYTCDLSQLLVDMVKTDRYGYYHATNSEVEPGAYISWADFTEEIYRVAGYKTKVQRVTTEEYGKSVAARPHNSRLDKSKLVKNGFKPLPVWTDAVERFIRSLDLNNL